MDAFDRTDADQPKQTMFRISQHIATVVFVCSLGGVLLSGVVAHESREIDQMASDFGRQSTMSRDLAHLESLVGQWLVSTDIIFGHGDTYLWKGAQDQSAGIIDLLSSMDASSESMPDSIILRRVRAIDDLTSRYVVTDAATAHDDRLEVIRAADRISSDLVVDLETLRESVEERQAAAQASLEARRDRFLPMSAFAVSLYVLVVLVTWKSVARSVVKPIEQLTDSARQMRSHFADDGPSEVRVLAQSLRAYSDALEHEKRELQAAESRSRESARRLETVMETAPNPILLTNAEGRVQIANAAAGVAFGFSPSALMGAELGSLFVETGTTEGLRDGTLEADALRANGTVFPVDLAIATTVLDEGPVSIVILRDLSEHHELEIRLRQAQKLESVGQLAAGMAHEINTPTQFIGDSVMFLKDVFGDLLDLYDRHVELRNTLSGDARFESAIDELTRTERDMDLDFVRVEVPISFERAGQGVERVASIVRAMMRFTHPDHAGFELNDLNHGIRDTVIVAGGAYRDIAEVDLDLGPIPPVHCDLGAINQVVLNLIVNAAHAIEASPSGQENSLGRIGISSRCKGNSVLVEVSDDGVGIPDEIQGRIFDPFFTTKQLGKGTGQGLALSLQTVEQHGGRIEFQTSDGAGTTFRLELPVRAASSEREEST